MTAVKEIRVTRSLLELGEAVTGCQEREVREECVSRRFLEKVISSCHCSPLHLNQYLPEKVISSPELDTEIYVQTKNCSALEMDCVSEVTMEAEECLEQCDGSIAQVLRLNSPLNEEMLRRIVEEYELYKYPESSQLTYPSTMKGTEKALSNF